MTCRMINKVKDTRKHRVKLTFLWLLLSSMVLSGCTIDEESQTKIAENAEVLVSFLKTEDDADCIMISSGERAVMIDTGEARDGKQILKVMEERGIETIDYMILTHPDKDHVGGAGLILENVPVLHVVEPVYSGDEEKEQRFKILNAYCQEKEIPVTCPAQDLAVSTKYLDFTVYPPQEEYYKKANNYSLAVLVSHGEVNMFFTGDALRIRTQELLGIALPEIDLYKVPHHGRANEATEEMFATVNPKYAVVTAYSAEEEVRQSCDKLGIPLFLTGEQNWEFVSDGKELRVLY